MLSIAVDGELLFGFAMLLARIGGLMVFAPFLGSFAVSTRIRVMLAVGLSLAFFPILDERIPSMPGPPFQIVSMVFFELLVGFVLGLIGRFLMASLQVAGTLMGFSMGFSLVNVIDPQTQVEVSVMGVLHSLAGVLLFVLMNGHHFYIRAMVESYRVAPPLLSGLDPALAQELIRMAAGMFTIGFQLAAPFVLVGVVVDVLLGIVGRSAPQIHILIAGLPMKVLVGFVMLSWTARSLVPFFEIHLHQVYQDISLTLRLLGR